MPEVDLTAAQRAAIAHASSATQRRGAELTSRLVSVLRNARCNADALENAVRSIRSFARVVVHFHPDRYGSAGLSVADSLLADARYRNQFETGLSSGSRTAFEGGSRDVWERELFAGAYHAAGVGREERPKYGALELIRYPEGPIPRFGSCYFVLRSDVLERCTFTFHGSEQPDAHLRFASASDMRPVLVPLLEEIADGGTTRVPWPPFTAPTLGVRGCGVCDFLHRVANELPLQRTDPSTGEPGRVLDSCVEAHVHGQIHLRSDVELLVADPSFCNTPTGDTLAALGAKYAIPLQWHCGFELNVGDVPDDFRGAAMPPLARRIAPGGTLTAAIIGAAEATVWQHPDAWADWGTRDEILQHLKQLWHTLVHFGTPARVGC